MHHYNSVYCPVVRYHLGLKIPDRYTSTEFFGVFPCQYCMSCQHTTPVCPVLHALCSVCHERGHTHNAHLTGRFNIEVERRRFRRFSALGFRTHSATVDGIHIPATKWGSKPNLETHDHPGQLSPGPHRTDYSSYVVNANPSPPDIPEVLTIEFSRVSRHNSFQPKLMLLCLNSKAKKLQEKFGGELVPT